MAARAFHGASQRASRNRRVILPLYTSPISPANPTRAGVMPESRKFMMPVDEEAAVRQMEVEAFRQIADGIKLLNTDMRDVRERLIRIESNQLDRQVKSQGERIDALERDRDKRDGASNILTTILKSPAIGWLAGAAVAAWTYLQGRH